MHPRPRPLQNAYYVSRFWYGPNVQPPAIGSTAVRVVAERNGALRYSSFVIRHLHLARPVPTHFDTELLITTAEPCCAHLEKGFETMRHTSKKKDSRVGCAFPHNQLDFQTPQPRS